MVKTDRKLSFEVTSKSNALLAVTNRGW